MNTSNSLHHTKNWKQAWQNSRFKKQIIIGSITLIIVLIFFSEFLTKIEQREGLIINDIFLNNIPSIDLSIPVFTIIWSSAALLIWQASKNPAIFITYLWAFIFLMISRMITIYLVPLNPPKNLVPLLDPLINKTFYEGTFITKDLFYSGHTATILLMSFCLKEKIHKKITLLAAICIAIMVLLQHIHYTIDVIAVPFFTYAVYFLSKKFVEKSLV
jgi:hypothetical protein